MDNGSPWLSTIMIALVVLIVGVPQRVYGQALPQPFSAAQNDASSIQPSKLPTTTISAQSTALMIAEHDQGISIMWPGISAAAVDTLAQLPIVRYQGYELPMQLITVALDGNAFQPGKATHALPEIQSLLTERWQAALQPATPLQPTVIAGEADLAYLTDVETVALPTSPLFLLRQGYIGSQPVAIWAFSPIYQNEVGVQFVTQIVAEFEQTRLVKSDSLAQYQIVNRTNLSPEQTSAVVAALALDPTNPDAMRTAFKLIVTDEGMQSISGAQLAEVGLDLTTTDPTLLQLRYLGNEVAIEVDGLSSGQLTANSTIRFYAPTVGDRWNRSTIYWLRSGTTPGLRMKSRSVAPNNAPVQAGAIEHGSWRVPKLYDSRYSGDDQDHWFHTKLVTSQSDASTLETVAIDVATKLPRIDGTSTYTIALTTNIRGQHTLRIAAGNQTDDLIWDSIENGVFLQNRQQPYTSTRKSASFDLGLFDIAASSVQSDPTVLLDAVTWAQPVALTLLQGENTFSGITGTWRYEWSALPSNYRFYDVTTPTQPTLLTAATATGFQDGPTARDYLLTVPTALHTPQVIRHSPVQLSKGGADAIYITYASFAETLAPLLEFRREQGYQVTSVDVQDIYDAWNFGHVSPDAIRTFLRYAQVNWSPSPYSVVLVGDGTWDPHNYEGKDSLNFIPPYLAKVDPWLGEAACENCYVQLNGDDPLTGDNLMENDEPVAQFFNADMWIGRFPVKTPGELTNIVSKLVSYESAESIELWQNRAVYIADNYVRNVTDAGDVVIDLAGDFAKHADSIIALAPATVQNHRIYYDPYPSYSDPEGKEPWRITNAAQALRSVLQNMSAGAGVVVYNGHSHQWQWAVTDESAAANPDYLLGLYDADALTNRNRYFINLSMTCLTSQFHKPAVSGTVLDERLFLNPNGGAIAVWGPAGLSVAYGHDFLQRGFFDTLWNAPAGSARLGELLEAGYMKLLTEDSCCQDTAKTFLLLGDPLTKARVYPDQIEGIYLPSINR